MKVAILDRKVRDNLALFKHLIVREGEKKRRFFQVAKKTFKAFVNRNTGELRFADLEEEPLPESEWQTMVIQLRPEKDGAFEVISTDSPESFDTSKLQKSAYKILTKTLHILNQLSYDPEKGRNPFWVMRHLSKLDFVFTEIEEGKRSLVHEAWHHVNRIYAEHLLKERPVGTYLFRKDEFAELLEMNLNENLTIPVTCITLTYSDWEEKICEKTLIFCESKWLVYDDDPELSGKRFETVKELLESLGEQIHGPLYAE